MNQNIIFDYLKEKNIKIDRTNFSGINIDNNTNEIVIKGKQLDLLELANYIVNIALSSNDKDHIHLDDLTLLNKDSTIKEIVIEKE